MNYAIATLIICIPMLSACLSDELSVLEVLVTPRYSVEEGVVPIPNYQVSLKQCRNEGVMVEYEERIPTIQVIQHDDPRQHSMGGDVLNGLVGAVLLSQAGGGFGDKAVLVMKTVKHTRYEQQKKCETVNEALSDVENRIITIARIALLRLLHSIKDRLTTFS